MHISKPCHERYDGMLPSGGGRHCDVCNTTVVDFTKMSAGEIKTYFENHARQNICGRYKAGQVSSDGFYNRMLWSARHRIGSIRVKPFRVALLTIVSIMFTLSSCIMGKRVDPEALKKYDQSREDSTAMKVPADTIRHH